jgi:putative transposase
MVPVCGRSASGERVIAYAPHGHWKTMTFVGALRQRRMTKHFVLEGAVTGPLFLNYVKQYFVPTLSQRAATS